jgi:hypothetical protein
MSVGDLKLRSNEEQTAHLQMGLLRCCQRGPRYEPLGNGPLRSRGHRQCQVQQAIDPLQPPWAREGKDPVEPILNGAQHGEVGREPHAQ